jgi:hypothetical protein
MPGWDLATGLSGHDDSGVVANPMRDQINFKLTAKLWLSCCTVQDELLTYVSHGGQGRGPHDGRTQTRSPTPWREGAYLGIEVPQDQRSVWWTTVVVSVDH